MPDSYRPQYHFSPPAHWMNDPNGLVYYGGEYHLFYQYHPGSAVWGPMHWGHAVSTDLVHWRHLPIALYPDENGDIFSGSALVDWHNTAEFGTAVLVAIFTHHRAGLQAQSLAYSLDNGRSWSKYSRNPVLLPPPPIHDFRDPKLFWYGDEATGHWVMCLAAGDAILFYTSANLRQWQPAGHFGPGYGATGGVWETPDLFPLPVDDGPETRWVLVTGIGDGGPAGGSAAQYFIGQFDGRSFTTENPPETVLWADFGPDYYAPQSWSNAPHGRRLMIAWMSNWQYATVTPTTTWRGAFSLPRELSLTHTAQGVRLRQRPLPELTRLRTQSHHWQNETILPHTNLLAEIQGDQLEIQAEFAIAHPNGRVGFQVRRSAHEQTTIGYDIQTQKLYIDRTHSGQTNFHPQFAGLYQADMPPQNGLIRLHIFVDRSSVELFGNDGLVTLSATIFPAPQSQGLSLFTTTDPIHLPTLDIYPLHPATFTPSHTETPPQPNP